MASPRPTCKSSNWPTAAPATRATSRSSCTSSTSTRCPWRCRARLPPWCWSSPTPATPCWPCSVCKSPKPRRPAAQRRCRPRHATNGRRKRASSNCKAKRSRRAPSAKPSCKPNRCRGRHGPNSRGANICPAHSTARSRRTNPARPCWTTRCGMGSRSGSDNWQNRHSLRQRRVWHRAATSTGRLLGARPPCCASATCSPMLRAISRTCCASAISTASTTAVPPAPPPSSCPGPLALVEALLERAANPLLTDEFGHTPWLAALNRAMEDAPFARQSIGMLFDRIAPPVLDVQTDARLVRLERHQAEYWILSLMLAGLKTQCTMCVKRPYSPYRCADGFFAEELGTTLVCLPEYLWKAQRHKRSYLNHVLARAEINSTYLPARRLWARTTNGHYLPNPQLQLRTHADGDAPTWRPVYEVLN